MELARLCWYMRGAISLEEMYQVGPEDREIFAKLIKENLETAKKTGQPFWQDLAENQIKYNPRK